MLTENAIFGVKRYFTATRAVDVDLTSPKQCIGNLSLKLCKSTISDECFRKLTFKEQFVKSDTSFLDVEMASRYKLFDQDSSG